MAEQLYEQVVVLKIRVRKSDLDNGQEPPAGWGFAGLLDVDTDQVQINGHSDLYPVDDVWGLLYNDEHH